MIRLREGVCLCLVWLVWCLVLMASCVLHEAKLNSACVRLGTVAVSVFHETDVECGVLQ